jgi:hypothetical protein
VVLRRENLPENRTGLVVWIKISTTTNYEVAVTRNTIKYQIVNIKLHMDVQQCPFFRELSPFKGITYNNVPVLGNTLPLKEGRTTMSLFRELSPFKGRTYRNIPV